MDSTGPACPSLPRTISTSVKFSSRLVLLEQAPLGFRAGHMSGTLRVVMLLLEKIVVPTDERVCCSRLVSNDIYDDIILL